MTTDIIAALNRRYATKVFDPSKKISQENMEIIEESLRLTPSSFGLQPRRFIQVKNEETRKLLKEASRNQSQITDAAELIIIATKTTMQESDVEEYMENIKEARSVDISKVPEAEMKKVMEYKNMMVSTITSRTPEQIKRRNQKQGYIAMGFLLETCAILGIDSCPMEGFDPTKYNEILELDALGLTATVVIPVGYRSPEDKYATLAKVRFPKEKLIITK